MHLFYINAIYFDFRLSRVMPVIQTFTTLKAPDRCAQLLITNLS